MTPDVRKPLNSKVIERPCEAAAGHGDFGNSKLLTSTPMRPKIMSRSRSFNESDFGGGGRRRTRSVSPAMADSAMTIVQSALNRKQLQVHALRTKLATR